MKKHKELDPALLAIEGNGAVQVDESPDICPPIITLVGPIKVWWFDFERARKDLKDWFEHTSMGQHGVTPVLEVFTGQVTGRRLYSFRIECSSKSTFTREKCIDTSDRRRVRISDVIEYWDLTNIINMI